MDMVTMVETKKYQGYVGLIGKPNVGKSSLINSILEKKVVIVNNKPQTTRSNIKVIFENDQFEILFIDTPGYHKPQNELDKFLNKLSENIFKKVDLIYFLIDPTREVDPEDIELLEFLKLYNKNNIIVVITKSDLIDNITYKIEEIKNIINKYISPKLFISVSSYNKTNIDLLLDSSKKYLYYGKEHSFKIESTWDNDEFLIKEIIREKCLNLLEHEIPYGIAINIDYLNYDEAKNLFTINANLIVEKESQKSIVIGKNGNMIKQIGIDSRIDLSHIYDSKIMLKLFVKVEKNWRNNPVKLKMYGYGD